MSIRKSQFDGLVDSQSYLVLVLIAVVAVSYVVEAARCQPSPPSQLSWDLAITVRYVDVPGARLRYLTSGDGPPLVLLHTLRTQLDMFQKVVPALASTFRVYALDYPGHGYSDIPQVDYTADYFVGAVAAVLERLDLKDAVVVGESIGGSIALLLAARHNPRVQRIVAVLGTAVDWVEGSRLSPRWTTFARPRNFPSI